MMFKDLSQVWKSNYKVVISNYIVLAFIPCKIWL